MTAHRTRRTLLWIVLAIAGLVIAVGASYAASQLSKPRVGLASEPLSGVERLAPAPQTTRRAPAPTPTQATAPPPASQDDGESGGDD